MRLFIALDLGKDTEKECKRLQELLPEEGLTKTKSYHLTLRFLGEVQPDIAEKIKVILKTITCRTFQLRTTSVGVFPSEKYIRVVWVGVDNAPELYALQKAIDDALEPFHLLKEKDFHPHITLARVKSFPEKQELLKQIKTISVTKITTPITHFILFESVRTKGSPVYKPLLNVALQ